MENNLTTLDLLRYMSALLIGSLLGVVIFWASFFIYEWISERRKKRRLTKIEMEEEKEKTESEILEDNIKLLNLSVMNDELKKIISKILSRDYSESGSFLIKCDFTSKLSAYIYSHRDDYRYTTRSLGFGLRPTPVDAIERYMVFLSEGDESVVDKVSTTYIPMILALKDDLGEKSFMSGEDRREYINRIEVLIDLMEKEIDKNFEKIRKLKYSKNPEIIDQADHIIKKGIMEWKI